MPRIVASGLTGLRWRQVLSDTGEGIVADVQHLGPPGDGLPRYGVDAALQVELGARHHLRACLARHGLDLAAPGDPGRLIACTVVGNGQRWAVIGDRDVSIRHGTQVRIALAPAPFFENVYRAEMLKLVSHIFIERNLCGICDVVVRLNRDGDLLISHLAWGPTPDHDVLGIDLFAWAVALQADPTVTLPAPDAEYGVWTHAHISGPGICSGLVIADGCISDLHLGAGHSPSGIACWQRGSDSATVLTATVAALATIQVDGLHSDHLRIAARLLTVAERAPLPEDSILPPALGNVLTVLEGGMQTTVQDSGRSGYWAVGVPPSGPMDGYSFACAQRCVGNALTAAGLEITLGGFSCRFATATIIALTGAPTAATLDGVVVPWWQPVAVVAGSILRCGGIGPLGLRSYLAIRGGIEVVPYLGSRATFTLGGFGGYGGRALIAGDILSWGANVTAAPAVIAPIDRPVLGSPWTLGVRIGPHSAPDYFTPADIAAFFTAEWTVSPQSNRTGIRLLGPKPTWARPDGGEAGLHPSNIHDNAYALGSVDFTGDMPVILGPDGPSLGGFVCPVVVVEGQRWKLGQLRPGDRLRFVPIDAEEATRLRREPQGAPHVMRRADDGIIVRHAVTAAHPGLCVRRAGDAYVLVEYGAMILDLNLRLRVQALHDAVLGAELVGIRDLTPGIRSLQIHFDPARISEDTLVAQVLAIDADLASGALRIPSRTVHLPLSWDDPATRKATDIYMRTVNPDAPWCPWNLEFIRRINGLDSVEDVQRIVFAADYLVLGLGDVYLGAPVATPIDPRHRLVTTKYNPARTWTAENSVGIGGAYMCIYGMEGPGGYQFIGRTVQVWNSWRQTSAFQAGTPWLLRQFDRIRFFPVGAEELLDLREDFPRGRYDLRIEDGYFDVAAHEATLQANHDSIGDFTAQRQAAFAAERQRWGRP